MKANKAQIVELDETNVGCSEVEGAGLVAFWVPWKIVVNDMTIDEHKKQ